MYREYQVPAHIAELAKQRTTEAFESIRQVRPKELAFGQLWSTQTAEQAIPEVQILEPRIVVILSDDCASDSPSETILVAPVSLELEFQSQYDLRVFEDESPLGYEFMIEVWNQTTTLVSQLNSYWGSLSEALKENLRLLNQVYLGLSGDLSSLSERIGWPILHENDPRVIFQVQEVEECEYLREPAFAAVHEWELTEVAAKPERDYLVFNSTIDDGSLSWTSVVEKVPVAAAVSKPRLDSLYVITKEGQYEVIAKFVLDIAKAKLLLVLQKLSRNLQRKNVKVIVHTREGLELSSEPTQAEERKSIIIDPEGKIDQTKIDRVQMLFTKA